MDVPGSPRSTASQQTRKRKRARRVVDEDDNDSNAVHDNNARRHSRSVSVQRNATHTQAQLMQTLDMASNSGSSSSTSKSKSSGSSESMQSKESVHKEKTPKSKRRKTSPRDDDDEENVYRGATNVAAEELPRTDQPVRQATPMVDQPQLTLRDIFLDDDDDDDDNNNDAGVDVDAELVEGLRNLVNLTGSPHSVPQQHHPRPPQPTMPVGRNAAPEPVQVPAQTEPTYNFDVTFAVSVASANITMHSLPCYPILQRIQNFLGDDSKITTTVIPNDASAVLKWMDISNRCQDLQALMRKEVEVLRNTGRQGADVHTHDIREPLNMDDANDAKTNYIVQTMREALDNDAGVNTLMEGATLAGTATSWYVIQRLRGNVTGHKDFVSKYTTSEITGALVAYLYLTETSVVRAGGNGAPWTEKLKQFSFMWKYGKSYVAPQKPAAAPKKKKQGGNDRDRDGDSFMDTRGEMRGGYERENDDAEGDDDDQAYLGRDDDNSTVQPSGDAGGDDSNAGGKSSGTKKDNPEAVHGEYTRYVKYQMLRYAKLAASKKHSQPGSAAAAAGFGPLPSLGDRKFLLHHITKETTSSNVADYLQKITSHFAGNQPYLSALAGQPGATTTSGCTTQHATTIPIGDIFSWDHVLSNIARDHRAVGDTYVELLLRAVSTETTNLTTTFSISDSPNGSFPGNMPLVAGPESLLAELPQKTAWIYDELVAYIRKLPTRIQHQVGICVDRARNPSATTSDDGTTPATEHKPRRSRAANIMFSNMFAALHARKTMVADSQTLKYQFGVYVANLAKYRDDFYDVVIQTTTLMCRALGITDPRNLAYGVDLVYDTRSGQVNEGGGDVDLESHEPLDENDPDVREFRKFMGDVYAGLTDVCMEELEILISCYFWRGACAKMALQLGSTQFTGGVEADTSMGQIGSHFTAISMVDSQRAMASSPATYTRAVLLSFSSTDVHVQFATVNMLSHTAAGAVHFDFAAHVFEGRSHGELPGTRIQVIVLGPGTSKTFASERAHEFADYITQSTMSCAFMRRVLLQGEANWWLDGGHPLFPTVNVRSGRYAQNSGGGEQYESTLNRMKGARTDKLAGRVSQVDKKETGANTPTQIEGVHGIQNIQVVQNYLTPDLPAALLQRSRFYSGIRTVQHIYSTNTAAGSMEALSSQEVAKKRLMYAFAVARLAGNLMTTLANYSQGNIIPELITQAYEVMYGKLGEHSGMLFQLNPTDVRRRVMHYISASTSYNLSAVSCIVSDSRKLATSSYAALLTGAPPMRGALEYSMDHSIAEIYFEPIALTFGVYARKVAEKRTAACGGCDPHWAWIISRLCYATVYVISARDMRDHCKLCLDEIDYLLAYVGQAKEAVPVVTVEDECEDEDDAGAGVGTGAPRASQPPRRLKAAKEDFMVTTACVAEYSDLRMRLSLLMNNVPTFENDAVEPRGGIPATSINVISDDLLSGSVSNAQAVLKDLRVKIARYQTRAAIATNTRTVELHTIVDELVQRCKVARQYGGQASIVPIQGALPPSAVAAANASIGSGNNGAAITGNDNNIGGTGMAGGHGQGPHQDIYSNPYNTNRQQFRASALGGGGGYNSSAYGAQQPARAGDRVSHMETSGFPSAQPAPRTDADNDDVVAEQAPGEGGEGTGALQVCVTSKNPAYISIGRASNVTRFIKTVDEEDHPQRNLFGFDASRIKIDHVAAELNMFPFLSYTPKDNAPPTGRTPICTCTGEELDIASLFVVTELVDVLRSKAENMHHDPLKRLTWLYDVVHLIMIATMPVDVKRTTTTIAWTAAHVTACTMQKAEEEGIANISLIAARTVAASRGQAVPTAEEIYAESTKKIWNTFCAIITPNKEYLQGRQSRQAKSGGLLWADTTRTNMLYDYVAVCMASTLALCGVPTHIKKAALFRGRVNAPNPGVHAHRMHAVSVVAARPVGVPTTVDSSPQPQPQDITHASVLAGRHAPFWPYFAVPLLTVDAQLNHKEMRRACTVGLYVPAFSADANTYHNPSMKGQPTLLLNSPLCVVPQPSKASQSNCYIALSILLDTSAMQQALKREVAEALCPAELATVFGNNGLRLITDPELWFPSANIAQLVRETREPLLSDSRLYDVPSSGSEKARLPAMLFTGAMSSIVALTASELTHSADAMAMYMADPAASMNSLTSGTVDVTATVQPLEGSLIDYIVRKGGCFVTEALSCVMRDEYTKHMYSRLAGLPANSAIRPAILHHTKSLTEFAQAFRIAALPHLWMANVHNDYAYMGRDVGSTREKATYTPGVRNIMSVLEAGVYEAAAAPDTMSQHELNSKGLQSMYNAMDAIVAAVADSDVCRLFIRAEDEYAGIGITRMEDALHIIFTGLAPPAPLAVLVRSIFAHGYSWTPVIKFYLEAVHRYIAEQIAKGKSGIASGLRTGLHMILLGSVVVNLPRSEASTWVQVLLRRIDDPAMVLYQRYAAATEMGTQSATYDVLLKDRHLDTTFSSTVCYVQNYGTNNSMHKMYRPKENINTIWFIEAARMRAVCTPATLRRLTSRDYNYGAFSLYWISIGYAVDHPGTRVVTNDEIMFHLRARGDPWLGLNYISNKDAAIGDERVPEITSGIADDADADTLLHRLGRVHASAGAKALEDERAQETARSRPVDEDCEVIVEHPPVVCMVYDSALARSLLDMRLPPCEVHKNLAKLVDTKYFTFNGRDAFGPVAGVLYKAARILAVLDGKDEHAVLADDANSVVSETGASVVPMAAGNGKKAGRSQVRRKAGEGARALGMLRSTHKEDGGKAPASAGVVPMESVDAVAYDNVALSAKYSCVT